MLGDEGMGYFNTAYQIYTWLYMLSTAGLPVALSLIISELRAKGKEEDAQRSFRCALLFFSSIGFIGSLSLLLFSRSIAGFIAAEPAYLCIQAIAPALFFVCISSAVRGAFQGKRNMLPTAVSEIIEAACKMGIGIAMGVYAINKGYPLPAVAAYAISGVTVGVALGAIFLGIASAFSEKRQTARAPLIREGEKTPYKQLLLSLLKIAVPIMLSSSLLSMSSMLDTVIIIRRLRECGVAESAAISLYGNYTAYCVTLFNLPPVLIYPIVNTLIPSITAANAAKDQKKADMLATKCLKLTAIITLPCALGLCVMSHPILKLIFQNAESVSLAAPLLSALAPSVFLIGIMAVTNALLQSSKLFKYSLISMATGAAIKAILAYLLPAIPFANGIIGIYAAPISTFCFYLTITVINVFVIAKHTDIRFSVFAVFARPLASAAICAVSAKAVQGLLTALMGESRLIVLISIAAAAAVYCVTLLLIGGITKDDIQTLPGLENKLEKIPLLKKLVK